MSGYSLQRESICASFLVPATQNVCVSELTSSVIKLFGRVRQTVVVLKRVGFIIVSNSGVLFFYLPSRS